jgi:glycosyltransferase involved in cell wall biosynthesis
LWDEKDVPSSAGFGMAAMTLSEEPGALSSVGEAAVVVVVIPCYRVSQQVAGVIGSVPAFVRHIVVVDDACPEHSGQVAEALGDPRVIVLYHAENRGVGGAMKTGFARALELQPDVLVKLDGDGQMDPEALPRLCRPLLGRRAAFAKYNRFWHFTELEQMPLARRIGNLGLSFLTKAASGYWKVFDPTNGYIAIRGDVLRCLKISALSDDYFFETSLLIELGKRGFKVVDLPLPAQYRDETSSMRLFRILFTFPGKLLIGGLGRVWYRHYWFDFTLAALLLALGVPLCLWGVCFGGYSWWVSVESNVTATPGEVMLAALPFLLGFSMLLQAVTLEISDFFNDRVSPDGNP